MVQLTFTLANGATYDAEGTPGQTLLQVAQNQGIDGFWAECGGNCTCATCHCYLSGAAAEAVPAPTENEQVMLDCVADERRPGSRLACQVRLQDNLNGLRVEVPARQI